MSVFLLFYMYVLHIYFYFFPPRRRIVVEQGEDQLPSTLTIVTDVGKVSREQGNCIVKEAVAASMDFWGAPFRWANIQTCT